MHLWPRTLARALAVAELIVLIAVASTVLALPGLLEPRLEAFAFLLALLLFTAGSLALGLTLFLMLLLYVRDRVLAVWKRHTPPFDVDDTDAGLMWGDTHQIRVARATMRARTTTAIGYLLAAYIGILLFDASGATPDDIPEFVFTLLTAAHVFGEEIPVVSAVITGSDRIPELSQDLQLALVLIFLYPVVSLMLACRNYLYLRSQTIVARAARLRTGDGARRDLVLLQHPITVGFAVGVLVRLSRNLPTSMG